MKISKILNWYYKLKENEYQLNLEGKIIPVGIPKDVIMNKNGVLKQKYIKENSPDNVDNHKIWKKMSKTFPLYTVGVTKKVCDDEEHPLNNIEDLNSNAVYTQKTLGALQKIGKYLEDSNILEIGVGFGSFRNWFYENNINSSYKGIDVYRHIKEDDIYKNDGKNIPKFIKNNSLDCVYSMNVFQHLSKKQRSSYYKSIHKKLKKDGTFIFGNFVLTDENKSWNVWQLKDKYENNYVGLFNQYTMVDKIEDLKNELESVGFKVKEIENPHKTHYKVFECIKI